jgi:hypothetical protein
MGSTQPEGKRPQERPRWRRVYDIKMHLVQIGSGGVDWIGLAQDRYRWRALVKVEMNLRVPSNAVKLLNGYPTGAFLSSAQLYPVITVDISLYIMK